MPGHEQIRVCWGEWEADVDAEIAALVEEIWRAGLWTWNSCQANPEGRVWIEFARADRAQRFLEIVAQEYDPDLWSLYQRIRCHWMPGDTDIEAFERDQQWHYEIYEPRDNNVVFDPEQNSDLELLGPPSFTFSLSVRFPRSDLAEVYRRVRAFNRQ
jgi:hypothetical protein